MIHLKPQLLADLDVGGEQAVTTALQRALELEHSTIPPYLYALYSLDENKNGAIADIIQSIVIEEMLHMTLVCNILNALGGSPVIDNPKFIPIYPGPLPGGVEADLTVGLAPFSIDVVHDVFMTIEEPEDPLKFPVAMALVAAAKPVTIGQFYHEIKEKIISLGDRAFCREPRNQIGPNRMDEAVVVTDVSTAVQAINTIVEQGEGTSKSPLEKVGDDYAHYYRFAEIYHGKQLIKNPNANPTTPPDKQFIFGGPPVPFRQDGVFPLPTNPKAADYPVGSAARHACDTFNYTYTSLLKSLDTVFNGNADQLATAIGLMMSLKVQAKNMMSGIPNPSVHVGPSFEYQPVNP
jgi:Ferritin-like